VTSTSTYPAAVLVDDNFLRFGAQKTTVSRRPSMAPAMPDPGALRAWVDFAIHERYRDYAAAVVVAAGLRNGPSDVDSERRLAAAEAGLRARGLTRAAEDAHLAAWRQAFSAFGAKPSKYPSSAEALATRVLKGQPLPRINRLVDLYNAISVRHLLPVGGEDSDRLDGPLRLVIAEGDEPFDPRGDGAAVEYAVRGEVIWRDDRGVTCRRWNWRQGARTQLTAPGRRSSCSTASRPCASTSSTTPPPSSPTACARCAPTPPCPC
jgi:DNA/RNA-binding domain of Phe-tRNA-synthetase-like protein